MITFLKRIFEVLFVLPQLVLLIWPATTSATEAGQTKNRYASALEYGMKVEAGDFAKTTIHFGAWNLVCDHLISAKRRVCVIEQSLSNSDISMQWRLALTAEGKPFLVFDVSSNVDQHEGLVLRVGKFISKIPFVACSTICRGEIAFDRFIEEAMVSGEMVGFGYTKSGAGAAIVADMRGFTKALDASAKPPDLIFKRVEVKRKARK